jgi:hypothetical protein
MNKESRDLSIAVVWHIEDVLEVRPDLNKNQAWQVLRSVKQNHDANVGINWEVLAAQAEMLYAEREEDALIWTSPLPTLLDYSTGVSWSALFGLCLKALGKSKSSLVFPFGMGEAKVRPYRVNLINGSAVLLIARMNKKGAQYEKIWNIWEKLFAHHTKRWHDSFWNIRKRLGAD